MSEYERELSLGCDGMRATDPWSPGDGMIATDPEPIVKQRCDRCQVYSVVVKHVGPDETVWMACSRCRAIMTDYPMPGCGSPNSKEEHDGEVHTGIH